VRCGPCYPWRHMVPRVRCPGVVLAVPMLEPPAAGRDCGAIHLHIHGSGVFALASTAPGLVAGDNGHEADDQLPGLGAQPQERAELGGGDPGITDHGQHFGLLLDQAGLILVVVAEEEARPHTESPGHRLDQALLRVGGLPVAQLPDGGVGDRLPSGLPDQGRDLGAAVGAAAAGCAVEISQFTLSASVRIRRCALGAVRNLTRHH